MLDPPQEGAAAAIKGAAPHGRPRMIVYGMGDASQEARTLPSGTYVATFQLDFAALATELLFDKRATAADCWADSSVTRLTD